MAPPLGSSWTSSLKLRTPELSESGGSLRLALIVTGAAAVIVAIGLFPPAVRVGFLVVQVAMVVLISGERRRPGSGWWDVLAAGVGISIAGALLAQAASTAGGIVAIAGAALVLVAATLGFPPGE